MFGIPTPFIVLLISQHGVPPKVVDLGVQRDNSVVTTILTVSNPYRSPLVINHVQAPQGVIAIPSRSTNRNGKTSLSTDVIPPSGTLALKTSVDISQTELAQAQLTNGVTEHRIQISVWQRGQITHPYAIFELRFIVVKGMTYFPQIIDFGTLKRGQPSSRILKVVYDTDTFRESGPDFKKLNLFSIDLVKSTPSKPRRSGLREAYYRISVPPNSAAGDLRENIMFLRSAESLSKPVAVPCTATILGDLRADAKTVLFGLVKKSGPHKVTTRWTLLSSSAIRVPGQTADIWRDSSAVSDTDWLKLSLVPVRSTGPSIPAGTVKTPMLSATQARRFRNGENLCWLRLDVASDQMLMGAQVANVTIQTHSGDGVRITVYAQGGD